MERSGNFYKAIRLGYILISILIGCMAYNSLYEWQEIEALELDNKKIDEFRKEIKRRNFAQYFNKQSLGFVLSAQSYCGGESLVGMLSAVGKQVLWRRIMADETWEAQVFGKNKKGK